MLSVRIVTTDHYMAPPLRSLDVCHSDFRNSQVKKVPVFRLFGATPAGQKTCMHIHGVFPYLYIPFNRTQPWDLYIHQFASSLDKAVNIALGSEHSNTQHVYKIALVSGIPMYGFHEKEQQFLKIYLYNPNLIRRVADLLQSGAVMNNVFQPHESHIPYPLQLFIDYNLYGMNMIHVAAVKFRQWSEDGEKFADNGDVQSSRLRKSSSVSSTSPANDNLDNTNPNHHWLKTWDKDSVPRPILED
ncbi:DNA polymerase zeta catalytic subunit-like [Liolophura sinensis]|uniref:DNA polymerase zeta catalytic subunit-like n=1 Tax=Liolophura sinensis TaxID=3198878 RepID=UPI0031591A3D